MIAPPPLIALHTGTAADPKGETTVTVVLGGVSQILGGTGFGLALRLEHQQTDRTALGVELAGGRGSADGRTPSEGANLTVIAVRGYGRFMPSSHDWTALTYGGGLTVLTTGMVTLNAQTGVAVSYPNQYLVPYLHVGFAGALPIRAGTSFGDMDDDENENNTGVFANGLEHMVAASGRLRSVRPNIYLFGDAGLIVPLGDTGHELSLDLGVSNGLLEKGGLAGLSIADRFH